MKINLVFALLATVLSLAAKAQTSEIFSPGNIAINGYDVVAFFSSSGPVKGADSLSFEWKQVTWRFSSRANLDSFRKSPERYSPVYGGYCAYGMSKGYKAPTQADTWQIISGKLYFNYNQEVRTIWNKDQNAFIKKADEHWPKIKNGPEHK